jgi:hypothetical protein
MRLVIWGGVHVFNYEDAEYTEETVRYFGVQFCLPELQQYNGCELIIDQVQKKCLLDGKEIDFKTYQSFNDKLLEIEKKRREN